jgi:hypothetical protein
MRNEWDMVKTRCIPCFDHNSPNSYLIWLFLGLFWRVNPQGHRYGLVRIRVGVRWKIPGGYLCHSLIASYGETEVPMMSGDGIWCRCHPILANFIGDYPEQTLVTCTYYSECPNAKSLAINLRTTSVKDHVPCRDFFLLDHTWPYLAHLDTTYLTFPPFLKRWHSAKWTQVSKEKSSMSQAKKKW